ncbi:aquaporin [Mycoplasmopsis cynos]|uniref:Aquaporin n=2 Tax=Mycoplasmopsis cynos TaxID=171284 RepID=A0ABD8AIC8_9BACT|nr:aquaporin [Mycoplasmopsis cynos]WQQ13257.1 aquaporin [Mycoplasmopsis cynos]WQQ13852.1 aquaporin [Mycoplasmopsis cynos]WQQ14794.1 aquaporin [Mycoplasmopsis cynos]WQQ15706.1 aquaporin [Mycoplasmopsis cynos]WQQ16001.1 aquaporin [Mycoplasmopsis cynos]
MDKKTSSIEFFKSLFSYFNLKPSNRINAEKPKDLFTWIVHGIAELFGSILLSLLLAGLSTTISYQQNNPIIIEHYFLHPVLVGLYAGFIAVGLVLFIFLRWSCDLNPAVSLTRYLNGTNDGWYASYKILAQFIGGIFAALIIYGVGHSLVGEKFISNLPINSISSAEKGLGPVKPETLEGKLISGSIWIFFAELLITTILLVPIFSPRIDGKYRDTFIMVLISFSVWAGILSSTAALNPVRGLAQQLPLLFFESSHNSAGFLEYTKMVAKNVNDNNAVWNGVVSGTVSMLLGTLFAPFFYLFLQGFTEKVFNPFVAKVISFKNYKAQNMFKPNKKDKK